MATGLDEVGSSSHEVTANPKAARGFGITAVGALVVAALILLALVIIFSWEFGFSSPFGPGTAGNGGTGFDITTP